MSARRGGRFFLQLFGALASVATAHAQAPLITSFDCNGVLEWTNTRTSGWYGVEWASSPTGMWRKGWFGMDLLPAAGSAVATDVPMYYRVVWISDWPLRQQVPVTREVLATADYDLSAYSGTLGNGRVVPGSVVITGGAFIWRDNGDGTMTGTAGVDGTINYDTGAWTVDLKSNRLDDGAVIAASYRRADSTMGIQYPPTVRTTNAVIAVADSAQSTYSGTLSGRPIVPGSLTINGGALTWTDDGTGVLVGTAGAGGTVNYSTGAWSIDLGSTVMADGEPITASYRYGAGAPPWQAEGSITGEILATCDYDTGAYSGILNNKPVIAGSVVMNGGSLTWTDNGDGTLSGTADAEGTIAYETGAWSIDLKSNRIANGELITAAYRFGIPSIQITDKLVAYGVAGRTVYSGTINNTPLVSSSITIHGGGFIFNDEGGGILIGNLGTTGTVNYATGAWSIDLKGYEFPAGSPVLANYRILLAR